MIKTTVINDNIYALLKLYKLMNSQTFAPGRKFIFVLLVKNLR